MPRIALAILHKRRAQANGYGKGRKSDDGGYLRGLCATLVGSAYHNRLDGLLDALRTDIDAGIEPAAPIDSAAKAEMVKALERILSTVGAQEDTLRKKQL